MQQRPFFARVALLALVVLAAVPLALPRGVASSMQRLAIVFIVYLVFAYAGAFLAVAIDPYFDDNGSQKYIEWRQRGAALLVAPLFAAALSPLLLFVCAPLSSRSASEGAVK